MTWDEILRLIGVFLGGLASGFLGRGLVRRIRSTRVRYQTRIDGKIYGDYKNYNFFFEEARKEKEEEGGEAK